MPREGEAGPSQSIPLEELSNTRRVSATPSVARTPASHFTTPDLPSAHPDSELEDELHDFEAIEHPLFDALDRRSSDSMKQSIKTPWKRDLWALFESPTSSSAAFTVHVASTGLICFSAFITILETLPPFHKTPTSVWFGIETALVVIFTVEYICRALAHSETWREYFRWSGSFFAIIDLLAIVPYYIELAIQADTTAFFRFSILRTFRLLRVFRPFRYSNTILLTIEVMYLATKRSKDALFALGFFVGMALVVFSTLLYFAERGTWDGNLEAFVNADGDPTQFESIPAAAWFVLVTITTVGYGEMIPRSFLGRLLTVPLLVFGLLLIALPSFVLGREFASVWEAMGGSKMLEQIHRGQRPRSNSMRSIDAPADEESPTSPIQVKGRPSPLSTPFLPTSSNYRRRRDSSPDKPLSSLDEVISRRKLAGKQRQFSSVDSTRGGITNLKLAQNQQVLSAQIDRLTELVETLRDEIKRLKQQ
ncbi:hypothetical protein FRC02_010610 [Tulasnella sp. 418]|nr:hypothetical protein FRC02_010610 [Tulasnella sp. 418]